MIITNPPPTQEIIAAGPATCAAYSDANSHPDPMIDPSEKKSSPSVLTSLCSLPSGCAPPRSSVCVAITRTLLYWPCISVNTHPRRVLTDSRPKPVRDRAGALRHGHVAWLLSVMIVLFLSFQRKTIGIVGHRSSWSKCSREPWPAV